MKKNLYVLFMICVFSFMGIWNAGCAREEKKVDSKIIFEQKCSQCHNADKIKEVHKNTPLSSEALKDIIQRMTKKPGCNINAKEAQEIEIYLLGELGPVSAPGR